MEFSLHDDFSGGYYVYISAGFIEVYAFTAAFIFMIRRRQRFLTKDRHEIDPDEIFLDAENLPAFDNDRFEGRLERPIGKRTLLLVGGLFFLISCMFGVKLWGLQIAQGAEYRERSERNRLHYSVLFAERGMLLDRNGKQLAWNTPSVDKDFPLRNYIPEEGFAHLLGFLSYPAKDSSGKYFQEQFMGKDGAELFLNEEISGKNGLKIAESDVHGELISESLLQPPENGKNIELSIDAGIQAELHRQIKSLAGKVGFSGGAGVVMDLRNGEIVALTSFPEFSSQILTNGSDRNVINQYTSDARTPFLNRVTSGLYTPGSIVKPFVAFGVLAEGLISPTQTIVSTGSISLPNPYDPTKKSVFADWKAHGAVDMVKALAVSSNVYFYAVGGGYENQRGLGITRLEKYIRLFGFGSPVGIRFTEESAGTVPNPEWKAKVFNGEEWRIGDTYHTAIGQYGFQVTPLQVVRAVGALGNGGVLLTPTIKKGEDGLREGKTISLNPEYLSIIKDGMREAVLSGTAKGLNTSYVQVAAKTGTAELGVSKQFVNSWAMGFFPYESPRYAFAVLMEKGPRENLYGSVFVVRGLLDWMSIHTKEYFTFP